jgi:hypothetical protein
VVGQGNAVVEYRWFTSMTTKRRLRDMKAVIRFTKAEKARALPILLRHSPGTVLPNRTYVLDEEAVALLRKSDIRFARLNSSPIAMKL